MSAVRGCEIPEDLLYSIEHNVWLRQEADGNLILGLTAYAVTRTGAIVAYTPKKVGKAVKKDKSCATVESGQWVGPAKTPIPGRIVATNDTVADDPGLISKDPYGEGWLVKLKPDHSDFSAAGLATGPSALTAYEQKMAAEGFEGCP